MSAWPTGAVRQGQLAGWRQPRPARAATTLLMFVRRGDNNGTGFSLLPKRQRPQLGCPTFSSWPRSELMTCGE